MKATIWTTILGSILMACMLSCAVDGTDTTDDGDTKTDDTTAGSKIIDHRYSSIEGLTATNVQATKQKLDIAYWHTSHGSQLVTGMTGMDAFYGSHGLYVLQGDGGLRLTENGTDLGNPGLAEFESDTRSWLAAHSETNVVMASWCGQVSSSSESYILEYLTRMAALEKDFPGVTFVYMTGHSDGTGEAGNLHARNRQIRNYCIDNDKYLYDFYDIECYNPDGTYFGDKFVTDNCDYGTSENNHNGNWATEWQTAHPGSWWDCSAAHSQPLNGNMKARAAWQLFVRIAQDK